MKNNNEQTYRCTGTCRRTGLTMKSLMAMSGANKCPYCCGSVVNEVTGKPRDEELPKFPDFDFARKMLMR